MLVQSLLVVARVVAAAANIDNSSTTYKYIGCYNETTAVNGTSGQRALQGTMEALPGSMTVQRCLAFCSGGSYKYAGLEYASECWCAPLLSSVAAKIPDSECNLACEGDDKSICGGSLKLTVYMSGTTTSWSGLQVGSMNTAGLLAGSVLLNSLL